MFLAAAVCGFTAVSVPNRAGATGFFVAMAGFVKLIRLLLIVRSQPSTKAAALACGSSR
jgi:hypothetical protein